MTARDPRFDPRPGDFRRGAALRVMAVGDSVVGCWRERMGATPREDWVVPTTATADLLDAFLYAAYAVGVVVLGVVAGLCVLAVPS